MKIYSTTYLSPLGTIVIESDGDALKDLRFADKPKCSEANEKTIPIIADVRTWLDDYFGRRKLRNVPKIHPQGTDFQQKVWQALLTIPYGQTMTYGEIAQMVGCRSAQAVGQAISRNPIALIIPCHRVVGAHGALGGYAFGIERKERLIQLEQ